MPNSTARSRQSSMLTLQICALSESSSATSSNTGPSALQGPHQGAQKSTTRGVEALETVSLKESALSSVNMILFR